MLCNCRITQVPRGSCQPALTPTDLLSCSCLLAFCRLVRELFPHPCVQRCLQPGGLRGAGRQKIK